MDKISHIVGSGPRVGATDVKSAPPVRPGAPSFGRPVGESPRFNHDEAELSTAQKVGLIQTDLTEQKKLRTESKIASDMANQFFRPEPLAPGAKPAVPEPPRGKIGVPEAPQGKKTAHPPAAVPAPDVHMSDETAISAHSPVEESLINDDSGVSRAPSRYSPRGSYIDVRA